MKNRLCSVVLVVISLMMFASKVTAVQNYTIIDLGILPEHTSSSAHAINDLGQVVGRGDQDRVFLYDDNGIHDLGFHGVPHDINNLGQIVGVATGSKAFLYSLGDLNILFSGNYHYAYGINDLGEVVGHNRGVGFLYSGGTIYNIPKESDENPQFHNYGINNSGEITGTMVICHTFPEYDCGNNVFLYSSGSVQDLGNLGDWDSYYNIGYDVNNSGQVVGMSQLTNGESRAFFHDGTMMQNLGTLGGDWSIANAINDSGMVVGRSTMPSPSADHAFLYVDGNMHDLNDLIPENSGWELYEAYDINNNGQIVGRKKRYGYPQSQDQKSAKIRWIISHPNP